MEAVQGKAKLAQIMGVSRKTVDGWVLRDCPVVQRGERGKPWKFDLLAVRGWLAWRDGGELGGLDGRQEKARLTKAQADHEELKVEVLRGNLIPAEKIEQTWSDYIANCRARLLAIPDRLGAAIDAETRQLVKDYVFEALDELSGERAGESPDGLGTPAESDGEPVGRRKPRSVQRKRKRAGAVAD